MSPGDAALRVLLSGEPGVAAEQDQLPPGVRLGEVRFEDRPVAGRQVPEDLGDAAVLARLGQFKRPIDCRCHASVRYHEWAVETNVCFRLIADFRTLFQKWSGNGKGG